MFLIEQLILLGGLLLLFGIASSKFSTRFGVPVLVLFLAIGMAAGSEGIGGIQFENYRLAHAIGILSLAMILFDGGLRTPRSAIRVAWPPSLALATVGVVITAVVAGLAGAWVLGLSPLEGILLGSIVGSTDAAAVFAALRASGLRLRQRLTATLEMESGANDPMAIFMTTGAIAVLQGEASLGLDVALLFVREMGLGAVIGLVVGRLAAAFINRINLPHAGMYPLTATAAGLLSFGAAASLEGSGFLAIYLTGIVIGNSEIVFQRGILFFHDATAWLSQITMFVVLGLLSFPSRLLAAAPAGLLIALVLIFVARPLAVAASVLPFGFNRREFVFLSWTGLRGAVPITLATFPLLAGLPGGRLLFDVVFFVVLVSAILQGTSLPFLARRLRLELPAAPEPPVSLEITSLKHVEGDIVDYTIARDARAAGRRLRDLALPDGVVVALISRGQEIIPPKGSTEIRPGDHAFVVLRNELRPLVDAVFTRKRESEATPLLVGEFPLRGGTRVAEIAEYYGVDMDAPPESTLSDVIQRRLPPDQLHVGARLKVGPVTLTLREVTSDGEIELVGMADDRPQQDQ
jgi:cell volume regulation protein A